MSEALMNRLVSRKFILSILVQVTSTALIGFGAIDGEQWTQLAMVVLGGFTLGNVWEHYTRSKTE